jgi:hypothetical protein
MKHESGAGDRYVTVAAPNDVDQSRRSTMNEKLSATIAAGRSAWERSVMLAFGRGEPAPVVLGDELTGGMSEEDRGASR